MHLLYYWKLKIQINKQQLNLQNNQTLNMGNQQSSKEDMPTTSRQKKYEVQSINIKVITLNVQEIVSSYEFGIYPEDSNVKKLHKSFMLSKQLHNLLVCQDIQKLNFKAILHRYSVFFNQSAGINEEKQTLMTRKEFEDKWKQYFQQCFKQYRQTVPELQKKHIVNSLMNFDIMCFFAILIYLYATQSEINNRQVDWVSIINNNSILPYKKFQIKQKKFFGFNVQAKAKKLIATISNRKQDIVFLQQVSPQFLKYINESPLKYRQASTSRRNPHDKQNKKQETNMILIRPSLVYKVLQKKQSQQLTLAQHNQPYIESKKSGLIMENKKNGFSSNKVISEIQIPKDKKHNKQKNKGVKQKKQSKIQNIIKTKPFNEQLQKLYNENDEDYICQFFGSLILISAKMNIKSLDNNNRKQVWNFGQFLKLLRKQYPEYDIISGVSIKSQDPLNPTLLEQMKQLFLSNLEYCPQLHLEEKDNSLINKNKHIDEQSYSSCFDPYFLEKARSDLKISTNYCYSKWYASQDNVTFFADTRDFILYSKGNLIRENSEKDKLYSIINANGRQINSLEDKIPTKDHPFLHYIIEANLNPHVFETEVKRT